MGIYAENSFLRRHSKGFNYVGGLQHLDHTAYSSIDIRTSNSLSLITDQFTFV